MKFRIGQFVYILKGFDILCGEVIARRCSELSNEINSPIYSRFDLGLVESKFHPLEEYAVWDNDAGCYFLYNADDLFASESEIIEKIKKRNAIL